MGYITSPEEAVAFLFRPSTYAASLHEDRPQEEGEKPDGSVNGSQEGSPGSPKVLLSMYAKKAPPAITTPRHQPHSRLWQIPTAGELMTFKASGEDTGGAYSLTDSVVPPGGGPPLHIHHREDEAFWVLEGELEVTVGETTFRAGAGSFVHLPKATPHLRERRHSTHEVSYPDGAGRVGEVL